MTANQNGVSRRLLLGGTLGGIVGASALPRLAMANPGHRVGGNGWPAQAAMDSPLRTFHIAGTDASVALLAGDVATVLIHVIRRFHYEVEPIRAGEVVGWSARHGTNHASGTAVDIRAGWHPIGATGSFFAYQREVIRDILAECGGTVRWGGDLRPADESHFEIDVPPADPLLGRVAATIRDWQQRPGAGAGVLVEPRTPARRGPALALERRQRRAAWVGR